MWNGLCDCFHENFDMNSLPSAMKIKWYMLRKGVTLYMEKRACHKWKQQRAERRKTGGDEDDGPHVPGWKTMG